MSRPLLNAHRLLIGLVAAMAVVALIGWTAYARSESSSATRHREHVEAMARMASERDGLLSDKPAARAVIGQRAARRRSGTDA